MMLLDGIDDGLTQLIFPGHLHTIFDMRNQNQARHGWGELVMPVDTIFLVFNKIEGFFDLADIMVISTHFCQQRIGSNFRCGRLHHGSHHHGMMIGAGCLNHEPFQNRPVQVGQLQQSDIRGVPKSHFNQRR